MMVREDRVLESIAHWLGCSWKDAEMIFNGVYSWNGANYSAFLDEEDELVICKWGVPIHRILMG